MLQMSMVALNRGLSKIIQEAPLHSCCRRYTERPLHGSNRSSAFNIEPSACGFHRALCVRAGILATIDWLRPLALAAQSALSAAPTSSHHSRVAIGALLATPMLTVLICPSPDHCCTLSRIFSATS